MAEIKKILLSKPFLLHFILWGTYFIYLWSHQIILNDNGWTAGGVGIWADGSAHLTYISAFANRNLLISTNPVYTNQPLNYPIAADWLTSLLVRIGLPINLAYILMGAFLSLLLIILMYKFFFLLTNKPWVSSIASTIFLLSGGLGGIQFIQTANNQGLLTTLSRLPAFYTQLEDLNIHWLNPIASELIPQRAFLLGLPVGLIILIILMKATRSSASTKQLLLAGLLTGLLPLIHPHTLIVIVLVSIWLISYQFLISKKSALSWFYFILPALLLGFPLTLWQTSSLNSTFLTFHPGWLAGQDNFIWFWLKNWGVFPILAIIGIKFLSKIQKIFLVPFILLFILANLISFQPYVWDNAKIFTWVHLALSMPAAFLIVKLWQKNFIQKLLSLLLFTAIIFSGSLDAIHLLQFKSTSIAMFTRDDLLLAEYVNATLEKEAVFLTSDYHAHWLPVLTGRQIVMGYRGWLWSYGIGYSQRELDVISIYQGEESAQKLLNDYDIDYVVIGPHEINSLEPNITWFNQNFEITHTTPTTKIYRVN